MTACVNRKHTKKVAAVVTASLVGALSLGAAPVAAMADTGINMQAIDDQTAFAQGTLTGAKDNDGRTLEIPADGIVVVEEGSWVKPSEITVKFGGAVRLNDDNAIYTYAKADGTPVSAAAGSFTPGRYTVTVNVTDGDYAGCSKTVTFMVVKAASLTDATLFDNTDGAENTSDTTFTYNGKTQVPGVVLNGKVLRLTDDYTITINATPVNAGTYTATITGVGKYLGQSKVVTFTVGKLDISKADVSIADMQVPAGAPAVSSVLINGDEFTTASTTGLSVNVTSYSMDATGAVTTGECTASVSVSGNTNFTNASVSSIKFNLVENALNSTNVFYGNDSFDTRGGLLNIDKVAGEAFNPARISVKDRSTAINSAYYTVTYTDDEGNEVDASALQEPGTYYVTVRVDAAASHYMYGSGDETLKVVVSGGTIARDDVAFKYDGVVGNQFKSIDYSGEDVLSKLETIVYSDGGKLTEGTDYTVEAYNEDGDKVDQIVDAGDYTVKIVPNGNFTFSPSDLECDITVNPLTLSELNVGGNAITAYTYKDATTGRMVTTWYLGYTGEDIEPALEFGYYTDKDGKVQAYDANKADELTWHALPEGAVTVTGYEYCNDDAFSSSTAKEVESISAKGTYKVKFALESGNYQFASSAADDLTENYITVSDSRVAFADVPADAWYAQSVFKAKQLDYVSGISGTNLFAPENSITRADALVIISRMAGADVAFGDDWMSQNISWITRYSDVDSGAYYAKAVAWATKVGIVHGYGDGTFQPNKYITREEFAVMLANYAKAMGDFDAADGTALDGMSDASTVSGWAEESVAWAVENEVMGNGGFIAAQNDISRAEVAAMAVNYQPEGASEDVIG